MASCLFSLWVLLLSVFLNTVPIAADDTFFRINRFQNWLIANDVDFPFKITESEDGKGYR
jgi:hypothetical protein